MRLVYVSLSELGQPDIRLPSMKQALEVLRQRHPNAVVSDDVASGTARAAIDDESPFFACHYKVNIWRAPGIRDRRPNGKIVRIYDLDPDPDAELIGDPDAL